jgi:hypothetical protein
VPAGCGILVHDVLRFQVRIIRLQDQDEIQRLALRALPDVKYSTKKHVEQRTRGF